MSLVHDSLAANAAGSSVAHSHQQFELLEQAVTISLSALDYADQTQWADALTRALCALANTSAGAVLLPGNGMRWRAVTRPPRAGSDLESCALHEESTERFQTVDGVDLVSWIRDDLANADETPNPQPTAGTIGLRVKSGTHVAAICLHRDPALGPLPAHLAAALRAITPAFRAGIAAWANMVTPNSTVSRMLDSLAEPAMMFDASGTLIHANPAVDRLMTSADASRIREEAQCMAWKLGAVARRRTPPRVTISRSESASEQQAMRRVRVGGSVYELRASIVGEQLLGAAPAVLVTITQAATEPLSDDTLRADFGLTVREIQVARLIAEGLSNSEIAQRLGIRFFTARNHVERALAKLGVSSRNRVGPMLRNEGNEERAA